MELVLEPGVGGSAIVLLDVGVILVGGKVGGDVRYAVCQPAGMGDREEILPGWMSRDLVVWVPEPRDPLLANGAAGPGLSARSCRDAAG